MWCVLSSTDALTHRIKESDTALASAPRGLSAPITQECVSAPGRLTGPLLPSHVRVYFPFGRPYTPLSGDSAVRLCALEAHASWDECLGESASTLPLPALAETPGLSVTFLVVGRVETPAEVLCPQGVGRFVKSGAPGASSSRRVVQNLVFPEDPPARLPVLRRHPSSFGLV